MKGITPTTIKPRKHHTHSGGFTIVELLIVIVVIGILAAITIVSFNGVSNRAKVASIQADLANSNKALKIAFATSDSYPATIAAAGLKASNGNAYQYTVNNAANPATFCLTTTNGTSSSYITHDSPQSTGTCPGHTNTAGPTITNLARNPSMETNLSYWSYWGGNNGAASTDTIQSGAFVGTKYARLTWSTATTGYGGGPSYNALASPNTQYASSMWVRSSKTQVVYMEMKYLDSSSATINPTYTSGTQTIQANVWTNIGYTSTAPSNAASVTVGVYTKNTAGTSNWLVGDYIDYDGAMTVQGSTQYSFADGNSPSWTWSNTQNNSTSSGPGAPAQ